MTQTIGNKVIVSKLEVKLFNARFPCSTLRDTRSYWFEFDDEGDLIDTDVPEQDDGPAATIMAADCWAILQSPGFSPEWETGE